MTVNAITLVVFLAFWPAWLVWELVLLVRRANDVPDKPITKLISMVARDIGPKASSVVYLWSGLGAHFWWTGQPYPGAADVIAAVLFWVLAVVLGVWDLTLLKTDRALWSRTLTVVRSPLVWLVVGLLAGRFLFPQAAT